MCVYRCIKDDSSSLVEKMAKNLNLIFFVNILYFCEKIHNWSIPLFNCEHIIYFYFFIKTTNRKNKKEKSINEIQFFLLFSYKIVVLNKAFNFHF